MISLKKHRGANKPDSVGGASIYELAPGPHFITLGVKGYQQTADHTCGPAAVMSLLHWYGRLADRELTKATEDRMAAELGTRDMASARPGTTPEEVAAWLSRQGFAVTYGYDGDIELLRANLASGIPTLVEWIDWGGHWVVVTGYHAASEERAGGIDTIFFADPAAHWVTENNPDGVTSFVAARFRDMWFDALCLDPGRVVRRAYVTAVPSGR